MKRSLHTGILESPREGKGADMCMELQTSKTKDKKNNILMLEVDSDLITDLRFRDTQRKKKRRISNSDKLISLNCF